MKTAFDKAAWRLNPADILTAETSPLKDFVMPGFVREFYATLKTQQESLNRNVSGGFLLGGAITDLHQGKKPRDYDVYVCIPDFLKALKKAYSYNDDDRKSFFAKMERVEEAIGLTLPFSLPEDTPRVQNHLVFGDYVETCIVYHHANKIHTFDLRIGSEPLKMEEFLKWVYAPCVAVAASLEEGGGFAYHRDLADHLERGIMQIRGKPPKHLAEKARRKGMTIEELPPLPPPEVS